MDLCTWYIWVQHDSVKLLVCTISSQSWKIPFLSYGLEMTIPSSSEKKSIFRIWKEQKIIS